jgi:hypothetical protein
VPSENARTSGATIFTTLLLLVGLPLLGAMTGGMALEPLLEFPPAAARRQPAPFSWPVFVSMAAFVGAVVAPLLYRVLRAQKNLAPVATQDRAFPWWGWVGLAWLVLAWSLAWSRLEWFSPLQRHTFAPLWLGYIVVISAWTWRRSGRALLIDHPRRLAMLFAVSALFWWYFEFLNRFVHNWYYSGIGEVGPVEYLLFGTLSFSTVLPAVVSTRDWLASFPRLGAGLDHFVAVRPPRPCTLASIVLIGAAFALANIGRYPDWLYPMLWMAPLLVLVSVQTLRGEMHVLASLARGDWRALWLAALAALLCGVFWEMWNYYSLAHWEYQVAFVQRFPIFEMPLLGYAGYLPFGIECLAIASLAGDDHATRRR